MSTKNNSHWMKVCGRNMFNLLSEMSNNQNDYKTPIICPPVDMRLNYNTDSTYSIYLNHAILITNGIIHAKGFNKDHRMCSFLPREILTDFTPFEIKDMSNIKWTPISAVCGKFYTLINVSNPEDGNETRLVYSFKDILDQYPLFLNTESRHFISLFGGCNESAAIDTEGLITVINWSHQPSIPDLHESYRLPSGERATNIAFANGFIFALDSNGRIFEAKNRTRSKLTFSEVNELKGIKIVDISGKYNHAFAVTEDGKVFGRGSNKFGELGIGKGQDFFDKFTEIASLYQYRIIASYAGGSHSLFKTFNGAIVACGNHSCGQLPLDTGPRKEPYFLPVETTIKEGATFCIAGECITIIF